MKAFHVKFVYHAIRILIYIYIDPIKNYMYSSNSFVRLQ